MASAASPSDNSPTTDSSKSSPADDPPSSSSESSPPSSDTSPPPPDDDKSPTKSSPSNADNTPNQPSQSVLTPNSGSNPAPSNPSSSSGSSPLPLNPSSDNSGEFAPPSKSGGNWKPGPPGVKHRSPPDGKDGEPDNNLNNNWKPGPPGVKHRSPPDGKDGDPDDNWKPGPPGVKHRSPPDGKDGDPDDSGGKSKSHESNSNNTLLMGIGLGIGMFVVLMLISALFYVIKKKRKPRYSYPNGQGGKAWQNGKGMDHNIKIPPPPGGGWQQQSPIHISGDTSGSGAYSVGGNSLPPLSPNYALGFNKSTFSYEEVAAATGGFAPSNMIGQGGFGYVYKGVLPTGKEVAVKQLKSGSGQGEREFQAEVEIISRVHHRHLVSLVGYCISGVQRMLIYDFVPNNTLEYHLHGKGVPTMDWPTRLKIAIGSAKGLAYLHEDCHPRIIHRDIKASNILIDYKYEAMVADFGLAKMNSDTNTHISTRVMGTFGYLAPEYASTGKLTEKSDVYSFGVMLLELISGRKPVDHTNMMEDSLVDWARPMLGQVLAEEKYELVVDPNLERNFIAPEMARMIACAAASVRHSARRRPKMSQIVRALEGDIVSFDDLNDGVKPGQSSQFSGSGGSSGSQDFDSGTYSTKMKQFRRIALEETNEYSNDYGLNPSDSSTTSSGEMRFGAAKKASQQV